MPSLWNAADRAALLDRVDRLQPDTPARWGKLTCPGMLAHLNDALRMPLGDVTPKPRNLPIRFFPLKQLLIYVLPFAKGLPTAPELLARTTSAAFAEEVTTFGELLARLVRGSGATAWPPHPAFGTMSRRDWGVLGYRHTAHHLTQFGA